MFLMLQSQDRRSILAPQDQYSFWQASRTRPVCWENLTKETRTGPESES